MFKLASARDLLVSAYCEIICPQSWRAILLHVELHYYPTLLQGFVFLCCRLTYIESNHLHAALLFAAGLLLGLGADKHVLWKPAPATLGRMEWLPPKAHRRLFWKMENVVDFTMRPMQKAELSILHLAVNFLERSTNDP